MDPGQLGTTELCSELRDRQAEVGASWAEMTAGEEVWRSSVLP